MSDELDKLLTTWRWNARTANVANLRTTDSLGWRNFVLGGTAAFLGAIVGLGIFATLESEKVALWVRIVAGAVAFSAAGLAALWKNLSYTSRIEEHRKASREYGDLVRQIDQQLNSGTQTTSAEVTSIREAMDKIDQAAPNVSPLTWMWAVAGVSEERKAREDDKPAVDASTVNRGAVSRLGRLWSRLFK
jgi:hypothetical protein